MISALYRVTAWAGVAIMSALAGLSFRIIDAPLYVAAIAGGALLYRLRSTAALALAVVLLLAGLVWSSMVPCSLYQKGELVARRLSGEFEFVPWNAVLERVVGPCAVPREVDLPRLDTKQVDGREWFRYDSDLGPFWIADPDSYTVSFMLWEILEQDLYQSSDVRIEPGDFVIDTGAHIGIFTRFALSRGAARVLAIEPDPVNRKCFAENLAEEIADGRVVLAPVGAWDVRTVLPFHHSDVESSASSFVHKRDDAVSIDGIPLLPIDEILEEYRFDRVDFIKMDIEGAERNAIRGARSTLRRFGPELAICIYHRADDVTAVPESVRASGTPYTCHAKSIELFASGPQAKVLFFSPGS